MEYNSCWFEIRSFDGSRMLLTRDVEEFERLSESLSRLHAGMAKFRIEAGHRSRIF